MTYYDTDAVSRNEYDRVMDENQRLQDLIHRAKDLAKAGQYSNDLEQAKSYFYEIELILDGV